MFPIACATGIITIATSCLYRRKRSQKQKAKMQCFLEFADIDKFMSRSLKWRLSDNVQMQQLDELFKGRPKIFVIGPFKVGKTWTVNKLFRTNVAIPSTNENTRGESIYPGQFMFKGYSRDVIVVDTEGMFQPMEGARPSIIRDLIIEQTINTADHIVFVMSRMYEHELQLLQKIIIEYANRKVTTSFHVIHNLSAMETKDELDKYRDTMKSIFSSDQMKEEIEELQEVQENQARFEDDEPDYVFIDQEARYYVEDKDMRKGHNHIEEKDEKEGLHEEATYRAIKGQPIEVEKKRGKEPIHGKANAFRSRRSYPSTVTIQQEGMEQLIKGKTIDHIFLGNDRKMADHNKRQFETIIARMEKRTTRTFSQGLKTALDRVMPKYYDVVSDFVQLKQTGFAVSRPIFPRRSAQEITWQPFLPVIHIGREELIKDHVKNKMRTCCRVYVAVPGLIINLPPIEQQRALGLPDSLSENDLPRLVGIDDHTLQFRGKRLEAGDDQRLTEYCETIAFGQSIVVEDVHDALIQESVGGYCTFIVPLNKANH